MNCVFGYGRVSKQEQDLQRQIDSLKKYGCTEIVLEKMTGTKADRPELSRLKDKLRAGDTVVVESWSRLGRSTKDLIELAEWFHGRDVKLVSLKENFDTTTPQGKLMMTVFQAFAQFERDLISQRTKESLASARARGRKGGRPKKPAQEIERALRLYASKEYTLKEIQEMTGVSASTVYRYVEKD